MPVRRPYCRSYCSQSRYRGRARGIVHLAAVAAAGIRRWSRSPILDACEATSPTPPSPTTLSYATLSYATLSYATLYALSSRASSLHLTVGRREIALSCGQVPHLTSHTGPVGSHAL